jgi:hypothetical protein
MVVIAVHELQLWTRHWIWALAAAALVTLSLLHSGRRLGELRVTLARRVPSVALHALSVLVLGALAWGLSGFIGRVQYDPRLGYHDSPSARGWGAAVRYVHREVSGRRVAFHGHGLFFPLYGDDLSNSVIALPEECTAEEALELCRQQGIEILVCFVPSERSEESGGYVFGEGLGPSLQRAHPDLEVLHAEDGAFVFRLQENR